MAVSEFQTGCVMEKKKKYLGAKGFVGTEKRREKVVVLRELQRAIIYTGELSKQAIEDHVSTAFIVNSVNEGARLTGFIYLVAHC
jgi:hypothetical protein